MGVLMKTHHFSTALSTFLGKPNRFPSPAKLNLFLYINGKLPNGYHELQTLFQFLDFGDWLTIDIRQNKQIHIQGYFASLAKKFRSAGCLSG